MGVPSSASFPLGPIMLRVSAKTRSAAGSFIDIVGRSCLRPQRDEETLEIRPEKTPVHPPNGINAAKCKDVRWTSVLFTTFFNE